MLMAGGPPRILALQFTKAGFNRVEDEDSDK